MILNIRNVELDKLVDFLYCNIKIFFVTLHLRSKMGCIFCILFLYGILWEVLFVDFAACMVGSGTAFNTLKNNIS